MEQKKKKMEKKKTEVRVYLMIQKGVPSIAEDVFFEDYDYAKSHADKKGLVVTNAGWLKRRGVDVRTYRDYDEARKVFTGKVSCEVNGKELLLTETPFISAQMI